MMKLFSLMSAKLPLLLLLANLTSGPALAESLPGDHNILLTDAFHARGYDTPYTSECTECHGQYLQGVGEVPSCYSCHGQIWSEPVPLGASLGDRVWEDLNTNGIQECEDTNGNGILGDVDPFDPANPAVSDQGPECGDRDNGGAGIAGVPVNLFQPDGNGDCTIDLGVQVLTGADGLFLFESLIPGDYCVQFDITALPDDFCDIDGLALGAPQYTALNVGADPAIDSDADPSTGLTDALTLVAVEINRTLDAGVVCPANTEITIDIKPGSEPNAINVRSNGKIPVAILTMDNFDASMVNASSVKFGPSNAQPVHYALEDVDGDGDWDLILHFKAQETGISCVDTEATLTGQTIDEPPIPIEGTDSVKPVGCNN